RRSRRGRARALRDRAPRRGYEARAARAARREWAPGRGGAARLPPRVRPWPHRSRSCPDRRRARRARARRRKAARRARENAATDLSRASRPSDLERSAARAALLNGREAADKAPTAYSITVPASCTGMIAADESRPARAL